LPASLDTSDRPTPPVGAALAGRCIALPEHRELDRLATMLEEQGARTVRCPLMSILPAPDPAPIETWLRALVAGTFHDLVFLTGEGITRLLDVAEADGLRDDVVRALASARKITRGPKPARALHAIGLSTDIPSGVPTSQGIIDTLRGHVMAGRRVGVQLYGDDPSRDLVSFLETKGASVYPVAPYRYAPASDDARVAEIIARMASGEIDAIAFTSAMQIDRFFQVARRRGSEDELRGGLARLHVAAIGPIVAEALKTLAIRVDSIPSRQFFMRKLTTTMAEALGPRVKTP
jgi:uroporphyrinogen-III synthase